MTTATLLSTAPTLGSILEAITDFYCGCAKTLEPRADGSWAILNADGSELEGMTVRKLRGRYRFEMED